jgi:hypothetical protein
MDRLLARRIEEDKDFRARIVKKAKDYLKLGRDALAYWSNDFDLAYDTLMCYQQMSRQDMDQLERGHPKRFMWPMSATQITTMTTYISQVLFGQGTPWKVDSRRAEDELGAEFINQLLKWNAEQQPGGMYALGYAWVQDCIAVNRGVFYNTWEPIWKLNLEAEMIDDPEDLDPETQQPRQFPRYHHKKTLAGGYNRMFLVSPYDFIADPMLPLWRLQEMRFTGHRTILPVTELRQRAKLPPEHPRYVLPSAVQDLVEKAKKGVAQVDAAVPSLPGVMPTPTEIRMSRTAYERTRALQPTGQVQADKADTGNVECWELWVRLVPSENDIYEDRRMNPDESEIEDEPVIFQILIGGGDVLLAINESTYQHGEHPYSVAEGRPNVHFQFSPSWIMILRGIQNYIDWLKDRHQQALSRTIGNIFVIDPAKVDATDFLDPDKEGLLITLKPECSGTKIDEVFQQVKITDMTAEFHNEAMEFVRYAETVTAANSAMQGALPENDAASATQFSGTMQMGAGRLTSIARLLSSQALVPQTHQFVSNFQQFMTTPQMMRFQPSSTLDLPPELQKGGYLSITRDHIQGEYDYIPHDGTLPGTDPKKVAALGKVLDAAIAFPQIFQPAPGNLDPRRVFYQAIKASGVPIEGLVYSSADLANTPNPTAPAPGGPVPGMPGPPPGGIALPPPTPGPVGPPKLPGPKPELPQLPLVTAPALENLSPPQARPGNQ